MYLAQENINYDKTLYLSIFRTLCDGQGESYKNEIDKVLIDSKKIKNGDLSINSIENEYFFLTSFLIDRGDDIFACIEGDSIGLVVYKKIIDILERDEIMA